MQALKTHVEFRSNLFPQTQSELEKWDGQIGGENLAKYLAKQLDQFGVITSGYHDEDWGYIIYLGDEKYQSIWIGCGHYKEYENGFLVFLNPSQPIIRKWFFKKMDISVQLIELTDIINKILHNDSDIHQIQWWENNDR